MEENILPLQPTFKLYKDRSVYIGTFPGGPLVAGYLAAWNFKQLAQTGKAKTSWAIAIAATIIIVGALVFIPSMEKVPNYVIPLAYTVIAQALVQKYQGAAIKAHVESGGQTFSNWRVVWIGLIGLVALMAVIVAMLLFTDTELFQ